MICVVTSQHTCLCVFGVLKLSRKEQLHSYRDRENPNIAPDRDEVGIKWFKSSNH
jgi:hypothetical protein